VRVVAGPRRSARGARSGFADARSSPSQGDGPPRPPGRRHITSVCTASDPPRLVVPRPCSRPSPLYGAARLARPPVPSASPSRSVPPESAAQNFACVPGPGCELLPLLGGGPSCRRATRHSGHSPGGSVSHRSHLECALCLHGALTSLARSGDVPAAGQWTLTGQRSSHRPRCRELTRPCVGESRPEPGTLRKEFAQLPRISWARPANVADLPSP